MGSEKKAGKLAAFAALSLWTLSAFQSVLSPALTYLGGLFPDIPYTTVMFIFTLPNLIALPVSFAAGLIAGKRVSLRTLAIIACGTMAAFGVLPYFAFQTSFVGIMVCRGIWGVGFGISSSIMATVIVSLFEGKQRARLLGYGTLAMSGAGIILGYLSGVVVETGGSNIWLVFALCFIPLIAVILWIPRTPVSGESETGTIESESEAANVSEGPVAEKRGISLQAWLAIVAYGLAAVAGSAFMSGASSVIVDELGGSTTMAGLVVSCYFAGGIVGGLLFDKYLSLADRFSLPIALLGAALVMVIMVVAKSVMVCLVGAFFVGWLYTSWIVAACFARVSETVPASSIGTANGIMAAFAQGGSFLAPYVFTLSLLLTGDSSMSAGWAIAAAIYALPSLFFLFGKKPQGELAD